MPTKRSRSYADLSELDHERVPLSAAVGKAQRERTRSGMLKEWQCLLAALQANQADLEHLGAPSTKLETLLSQAKHLVQCQAALEASKREATQRLNVLLADCQRLATVLRFSLKYHYGPAADKLTDFGIQPVQRRAVEA